MPKTKIPNEYRSEYLVDFTVRWKHLTARLAKHVPELASSSLEFGT